MAAPLPDSEQCIQYMPKEPYTDLEEMSVSDSDDLPSMITTSRKSQGPARWCWVLGGILVLFIIGFLTFQTAPDGRYWQSLGATKGQCSATQQTPYINGTKKNAIIAAIQKKDETVTDWIVEHLPEWEPQIYVTDRMPSEAPTNPSSYITPNFLPINQGREAAVYLTYIIENYYDLPEFMVFIHGKRYQIHNGTSQFPLR
jgi:hypothetical protein